MLLLFSHAMGFDIKEFAVLPEVAVGRILKHVDNVTAPDLEAKSYWTAQGEQGRLVAF
jgi:hypothetical protein